MSWQLMSQFRQATAGYGHAIIRMLAWTLLAAFFASIGRAADINVGQVLEHAPDTRGIAVIVVDHGNALVPIELAKRSKLTIFVQTDSRAAWNAVVTAAMPTGLLGTRIVVSKSRAGRIELADNLADIAIADVESVSQAESMRVLRPGGVLLDGRSVSTKPVPKGSGEWTHPYHGADNNPQSEDSVVKAPYLTNFLATPWYGPMPQITVSSGGRLFKVFGHLAFKEREWPLLGKLVAINAYNGTKLWERDLTPGFMVHRSTIIASPDTLYVADNESLKLIDTATGEVRDEIKVPDGISDGPAWKWMTIRDGKLIALVGEAEKLHEVHRGTRTVTGWPWTRLPTGLIT